MVTEIRERPLATANDSGNGRSLSPVPPSLESGFNSSRIVSMYDLMKRFGAHIFMEFASLLAISVNQKGEIRETTRKGAARVLETFKTELRVIGLDASKATTQKMLELVTR